MNLKDIHANKFIKAAIYLAFVKKLLLDSYCDVSKYLKIDINKGYQEGILTSIDSPYKTVMRKRFPQSVDELESSLNSMYNSKSPIEKSYDPMKMRDEEVEAIFVWILPLCAERRNTKVISISSGGVEFASSSITQIDIDLRTRIILSLIALSLEDLEPEVLKLYDRNILKSLSESKGVVYFSKIIELNFISSISSFSRKIKAFEDSNEAKFFRGQSNINYALKPSIMRSRSFFENERKMYNELLISSPEYFDNMKSHLEILVEMQHYGLPTRLLDITNNPLVALYFACNNDKDTYGEVIMFSQPESNIKYSQSDTVTILASLPLFTDLDQKEMYDDAISSIGRDEFNIRIQRLLHEVKTEKPAFRDNIKKEDLLMPIIVLPQKKNKRIIKQDGAFIICGLSKDNNNSDLNNLRFRRGKIGQEKIQIFVVEKKPDILAELNSFSINKATLFPEIDTVAEHIKAKFTNHK